MASTNCPAAQMPAAVWLRSRTIPIASATASARSRGEEAAVDGQKRSTAVISPGAAIGSMYGSGDCARVFATASATAPRGATRCRNGW